MVVVMKPNASKEDIAKLAAELEQLNLKVSITEGHGCSILGLVGDTTAVDMDKITINQHVERVMRVSEPYKKANRLFHEADSVIDVAGVKVGGKEKIAVIGGPCSVEGKEQVVRIAEKVKAAGGTMLRGGAYKPRTSPYAFLGLGT